LHFSIQLVLIFNTKLAFKANLHSMAKILSNTKSDLNPSRHPSDA
jgi:hypothetical protein